MSNIYCRACGAQIHESATDCPNCGAKQQIYTKSKVTAVLLCFFFGFIGIHRFYLGRPWSGIAYLIASLTVVGAAITIIVAFIEFIILACTSEQEINRKYGVKK